MWKSSRGAFWKANRAAFLVLRNIWDTGNKLFLSRAMCAVSEGPLFPSHCDILIYCSAILFLNSTPPPQIWCMCLCYFLLPFLFFPMGFGCCLLAGLAGGSGEIIKRQQFVGGGELFGKMQKWRSLMEDLRGGRKERRKWQCNALGIWSKVLGRRGGR